MAWCGCSRKGRQCLASSGGGAAGWSVSTSTPYIPWQRRSNKALQPFSGGVYGWVFCAKNWQLHWLKQEAKRRVDAQSGARFLTLRYPLYTAEAAQLIHEWMDRVDYGA